LERAERWASEADAPHDRRIVRPARAYKLGGKIDIVDSV
jgi:hypothetical protein